MSKRFKLFDAVRIVKLEDGAVERPVYCSRTGKEMLRIGDVGVMIGDWVGGKLRLEAVTPDGAIDWQDHVPAEFLEGVDVTEAPYCRRRVHEKWAWFLGLTGPDVVKREWDDALDLARKVMAFARVNVDRLIERLSDAGYQFANPNPHVLPDPDCDTRCRALAERGVHLPIALQAWLMEVGRVDLCGTHPDWKQPGVFSGYDDDHDGLEDNWEPWYCDPLVIDVDLDSLIENDEGIHEEGFVDLAPDAVTKANVSGGGPIHVAASVRAFDSVLIGQHGSLTLHAYLQQAFAWGGFPGFEYIPDAPVAMLRQWSQGLVRL